MQRFRRRYIDKEMIFKANWGIFFIWVLYGFCMSFSHVMTKVSMEYRREKTLEEFKIMYMHYFHGSRKLYFWRFMGHHQLAVDAIEIIFI